MLATTNINTLEDRSCSFTLFQLLVPSHRHGRVCKLSL